LVEVRAGLQGGRHDGQRVALYDHVPPLRNLRDDGRHVLASARVVAVDLSARRCDLRFVARQAVGRVALVQLAVQLAQLPQLRELPPSRDDLVAPPVPFRSTRVSAGGGAVPAGVVRNSVKRRASSVIATAMAGRAATCAAAKPLGTHRWTSGTSGCVTPAGIHAIRRTTSNTSAPCRRPCACQPSVAPSAAAAAATAGEVVDGRQDVRAVRVVVDAGQHLAVLQRDVVQRAGAAGPRDVPCDQLALQQSRRVARPVTVTQQIAEQLAQTRDERLRAPWATTYLHAPVTAPVASRATPWKAPR